MEKQLKEDLEFLRRAAIESRPEDIVNRTYKSIVAKLDKNLPKDIQKQRGIEITIEWDGYICKNIISEDFVVSCLTLDDLVESFYRDTWETLKRNRNVKL